MIFVYKLYLNEDYKSAHYFPFRIVYHSFEVANASPYCNSDLEKDRNDNHSQIIKIPSQKTTVMVVVGYAPLDLQYPLHDLPWNYGQRLPKFDGTGPTIGQQHIDKMNDFVDVEEVDFDDVKMRIFAQNLAGEVRKWQRTSSRQYC